MATALTPTTLAAATVNRTEIQSAALAAADAAGNTVPNPNGDTYLVVENGDASAKTLTVAAQVTNRPGGGGFPAQTVDDVVASIAAGETELIGPFPTCYNDGNGNLNLSWSAVTSVKVLAIKMPS